jgi:hypothetical protein
MDIKSHVWRLAAWHDWVGLQYINTAYEVDGGLNTLYIEDEKTRKVLSKTIHFASAMEALVVVTYNAGLVYLMELCHVIRAGRGDIPDDVGLSMHDLGWTAARSLLRNALQPSSGPQRDQIRDATQPALEALRIMPFLHMQLALDDPAATSMVPLAPFGILYSVWKRIPQIACGLRPLVGNLLWFRNSDLLGDFDPRRLGQQ